VAVFAQQERDMIRFCPVPLALWGPEAPQQAVIPIHPVTQVPKDQVRLAPSVLVVMVVAVRTVGRHEMVQRITIPSPWHIKTDCQGMLLVVVRPVEQTSLMAHRVIFLGLVRVRIVKL
jgi:hypothetical protein